MTTPEGRVKRKVNAALKTLGDRVWKFMPVQASAFGMPALDYILCVNGKFFAIETKAPGKRPSPRQWQTIDAIGLAGGMSFIVDDDNSLNYAMVMIHELAGIDETQKSAPPLLGS